MIREIGEAIGDTVVESVGRAVARTQEQRPLSTDLLESDDAYLAVFDAPGAESEDVQVRFEDGNVFVRIDRYREFREGYEMRFPGRGLSLEGNVSLPDDGVVDPGEATATLTETGVLQVRIPKAEAGGETIEIESEADTGSPDDEEPNHGDDGEGTDGDEEDEIDTDDEDGV